MHYQIRAKFERSYPLLMHQRGDHSFVRFGLEISSGWLPLVYELFGLMDDLQAWSSEAVSISQVKEKFGSLRVYVGCSNKIAYDINILTSVFESLSARVCDICGSEGRRKSDNGYWCTRCGNHRNSETHETLNRAYDEASERFLAYERKGVDTRNIVYLHAYKSDQGGGYGCLKTMAFPDRLHTLHGGLIKQLEIQHYVDQPVTELSEAVRYLKAHDKRLVGITDGSESADKIMGRPY